MTTAKNDITGDSIATKETTDAYRDGYDRIFGKKAESCDMAEMCLDCQPRGENGECPDNGEPAVKLDADGRALWPFPTINGSPQ